MPPPEILKELALFDPEIADRVAEHLTAGDISALSPHVANFTKDVIRASAEEPSFGLSLALGFLQVLRAAPGQVETYRFHVWQFGGKGPALGTLMANHLASILACNDLDLLGQFLRCVAIMLQKGVYTLYGPLKVADLLCAAPDRESLIAYLDLLGDAFSLDLTYKQCRPLTYTLPTAVAGFSPRKRAFQTRQLAKVIRTDFTLVEDYLEGLAKGLGLLSAHALTAFVDMGMEKYRKNKKLGARFLALDSRTGTDAFAQFQVTVSLAQVRHALHQYINARTGFPVAIHPLSLLVKTDSLATEPLPWVCSDGKTIYLPDEIDHFPEKEKNSALFKTLTKLEVGFFEGATFDFDLDKLCFRIGEERDAVFGTAAATCDLEAFIHHFEDRGLSVDLFTLFEHARIKDRLSVQYPGLIRHALPILQAEALPLPLVFDGRDVLQVLYRLLVLDLDTAGSFCKDDGVRDLIVQVKRRYDEAMAKDPAVETSAELVLAVYSDIEALYRDPAHGNPLPRLKTPFNRKIEPGLYHPTLCAWDRIASRIQRQLLENGIAVYRSDIRKRLVENDGALSTADIREIVLTRQAPHGWAQPPPDASDLTRIDLSGLLNRAGVLPAPEVETPEEAIWYREWDTRLGDYLHNHVRVCRRTIPAGENDFYSRTLERYPGLADRIRYAFELMKPEKLVILRQWVEGDAFDYRALLDFAMDRKAGIMPSDRLYIKRLKKHRDVAVLLLVDLSRSTANPVPDSPKSVLTVEKEAIVLFCEALETVGDMYGVAGFSGSGRLGVDYFEIKAFDAPLSNSVRQRIGAMSPQRSTRMGAAIRHATDQLEKLQAKVKLLILLGDGFPNDVDYKGEYAISDTRRAISEARAKNIHTHGLTVNIAGDPKLDELYGRVHHHVITDVRSLPDELPRIYSTLTRQ